MINGNIIILAIIGLVVTCSCNLERERPSPSKNKPSKELTTKKSVAQDTTKKEEQVISVSPEQLDKAKSILASVNSADVEAVDTKKLYKTYCAICHGMKGNAMVNGAKDLTKSVISKPEAVAQIYFGKGLMTPFKEILNDAQVVAMAEYSASLRK